MKGSCKLCGLEKELVKSHIIPNFMYKFVFDDKHKLILTDTENLKILKSKRRTRNTGDYDNSILCATCDNEVIGQYETYASKVIYGEKIPISIDPVLKNYYNERGTEWTECSNINYKSFKLFMLSILWRASITKCEMFSDVNIGSHEDIIKSMLWNADPKNEDDYPMILVTTNHDQDVPKDFILQPRTEKLYGHHIVIFPISGMLYIFFVSSHKKPDIILDMTLKKNNTMIIERIPVGLGMDYLLKYIGAK